MKRWVAAQKIGVAAYCLRVVADSEQEESRKQYKRLGKLIASLVEDYNQAWGGIATMPPSTLYLLKALPAGHVPERLADLPNAVEEQIQTLITRDDALIGRCKVFAYHVMNGVGAPTRITRLGRSLFGKGKWQDLERDEQAMSNLADVLASLRNGRATTQIRIKAIAALAELLSPWYRAQVENILFHQVFAWPLLVLRAGTIEVGLSLPVGVDVAFDPRQVRRRPRVKISGLEQFDLSVQDDEGLDWRSHLRFASEAGWRLWQGAHGHFGEFRRVVRSATVKFFFRWAGEVIRDVISKMWLGDGSATAYFSQVVLSRLLGRQGYLSSAATGLIGERVKREDGKFALDYELVAPGSVDRKTRYVFDSHLFERNVLPDDKETIQEMGDLLSQLFTLGIRGPNRLNLNGCVVTRIVPGSTAEKEGFTTNDVITSVDGDQVQSIRHVAMKIRAKKVGDELTFEVKRGQKDVKLKVVLSASDASAGGSAQTAEVLFVRRLSNLADAMQVQGWRKTHYIRCPEVAWAVHGRGRPGLIAKNDPQVAGVVNRMRGHDNCILRLEKTSPTAVVSALCHLNAELRDLEPYPPPGLSWSVVRLPESDYYAGFWTMLWRLIGAPVDEYALLSHSPTTAIAAHHLARALNCFDPDADRPSHRAPDIIVVVGADRFWTKFKEYKNPRALPLAVAPVLDNFESTNGLRIADSRRDCPVLAEKAGKTRVILIPDPTVEEVREPLPPLFGWHLAALEALKTLRWGFSQQMASLLLAESGVWGIDVRRVLRDLTRRELLRYALGQYHLPAHVREAMKVAAHGETDWSKEARQHMAAGAAYAPYSITAELPGLAYDTAFLAEHVHEAHWHFEQAFRLYEAHGNEPGKGRSRTTLKHITQYTAVPGWATVWELLANREPGAGKDAYEMALELITGWRDHPDSGGPFTPHPSHLCDAATALQQWQKKDAQNEIMQLYYDALDSCRHYPGEEEFNRLKALTGLSNFIADYFPEERQSELEALDKQINELKPYWDRLRGDWFERVGDREADPGLALATYLLGIQYAPKWYQLPMKAIGAAKLAGQDCEQFKALAVMLEKDAMTLLGKAENGYKTDCRRGEKSRNSDIRERWNNIVQPRWEAAFKVLQEIWRTRPVLLERLKTYFSEQQEPVKAKRKGHGQDKIVLGQSLSGSVKWTFQGRNYNFIKAVDGMDYQFDRGNLVSGLTMEGMRAGDEVEFIVIGLPIGGRNGKADNIRRIDTSMSHGSMNTKEN